MNWGLFGMGKVHKRKTLCVRYFTRFIEGSFYNEPVNTCINYALANSLNLSGVHWVLPVV